MADSKTLNCAEKHQAAAIRRKPPLDILLRKTEKKGMEDALLPTQCKETVFL